MSIFVSNIKMGIDDLPENAFEIAKAKLKISDEQIHKMYISKKSLDARHRGSIGFVVTVAVDLTSNESEIANAISDNFVVYREKKPLEIIKGTQKAKLPIAVIGFGPAGIFAAYLLSKQGYKVTVFERGGDMEQRTKLVDDFWNTAKINESTNVQFGEGGAGTFSDGKLTTRISDSRCDYVLETLYKNGAPQDILENAKPHIGTDMLRSVIVNMRNEIIKTGGKVCYNSKLEKINLSGRKITSIRINDEDFQTDNVVLAIGHSARDTFRMLLEENISIESKPFSVGLRIEQLQSEINKGLYGDLAGAKNLPHGEYQLSQRCKERAVYTFCMCPGGLVVPSASGEGQVVTNGMSYHSRDGANANSALVVSVDKSDYGSSPLAGILFQEKLEKTAFEMGGGNYKAPYMTVGEFIGKNNSTGKEVVPSYPLGVTPCDLHKLFPAEIDKMLRLGLQSFESKLHGFSAPSGILTGVESRTSSPIRILRSEETLESIDVDGLYPCGEGAGYAGGIVSAAVDGIRVAQKIMAKFATD